MMSQRGTATALAAAVFVVLTAVVAAAGFLDRDNQSAVIAWPKVAEVLPAATSEIPADFGRATWALDPAFGAPSPTATELHLLVWERTCSSGRPTTGRMSAPVVEVSATTISITIGVRPLTDPPLQTCPGPPGTPALIQLDAPLGDRTLLDGTTNAPPSPAFIFPSPSR